MLLLKTTCVSVQNLKGVAQGSLCDMNYYLHTANMQTHCVSEVALIAGLKRWHERLEHVHTEAIRKMYCHRVVEGLEIGFDNVSEKCVSYIHEKSRCLPIP